MPMAGKVLARRGLMLPVAAAQSTERRVLGTFEVTVASLNA